MPKIEIFEPAGCCATSSAVVDQSALRFNADVEWCKQNGAVVKRHNLSKNPQIFLSNPAVKAFLDRSGAQSLPLTLVDGAVVLAGRLPERSDLARWAGLSLPKSVAATSSCCAPSAPVETAAPACCAPRSRA